MDGERLSLTRHCSKGVEPVAEDVYHSGCHDRHITAHGAVQSCNLAVQSSLHHQITATYISDGVHTFQAHVPELLLTPLISAAGSGRLVSDCTVLPGPPFT